MSGQTLSVLLPKCVRLLVNSVISRPPSQPSPGGGGARHGVSSLKAECFDELVLIYANRLQPDVGDRPFGNFIVSDDPGLHAISDVVDFRDARTEIVP